jgi:hypothetical protein
LLTNGFGERPHPTETVTHPLDWLYSFSHPSPVYKNAYISAEMAEEVSGGRDVLVLADFTNSQDFFALWKDADPDVPTLIQARQECAALSRCFAWLASVKTGPNVGVGFIAPALQPAVGLPVCVCTRRWGIATRRRP